MSEEKITLVLCTNYDLKLIIHNNRVGAFKSFTGSCGECGAKIIMTGATRRIISADPKVKPVCPKCFEQITAAESEIELSVTEESLREVSGYFTKIQAQHN